MLENTTQDQVEEVAAVEAQIPAPEAPAEAQAAAVLPARKLPKVVWMLLSVLLALVLVGGGALLGVRWFEAQSLRQARTQLQNQDWAGAEATADRTLQLQATGLLAAPLDLRLARAEARYQLKKYTQADADFRNFQAAHPQEAAPYLFQAKMAFEQGKLNEALKAAGEAQARDSQLAFPYALQALDAYRQNHLTEALKKANQALQRDPQMALAYQVRGSALAWQMDVDGALADLNRALELQPNQPEVLAVRAYLHFLRNNGAALTADANAIHQAAPGTPAALWTQALVGLKNFDEDSALRLLDQAIAIDGARPEFYLARAQSYYKTEQEKQVLADYDQALKLNPDFAPAIYGKTIFLYDRYKTVDIEAQANRLLALAPKANLGHLLLVEKYLREREWKKAMQAAEKAIAAQPGPERGYLERGQIYAAQHEYKKAIADLQKVIQQAPKSFSGYIGLARVYVAQGAYEDAFETLDRVAKMDPDSLELHYARALVYANKEDVTQARKEIEAALQRDAGNANAILMRVTVGMLENNRLSALADLNRVAEIYPEDPRLMLLRASIFAANEDAKAALAELTRAEKIDNKLVDLYTTRAQIYLTQGELKKVAEDGQKALKLDPKDGNAYWVIGAVDLEQKKNAEAAYHLSKAIELKPTLRAAYYPLGLAQWNLGEVETALKTFQKMLALKGLADPQTVENARQMVAFLKTVPALVDGRRTVKDPALHYSLSYSRFWVPRPPQGHPASQFMLTAEPYYTGVLQVQVEALLDEKLAGVLTPGLLAEFSRQNFAKVFANYQWLRREVVVAQNTRGIADIADYSIKNASGQTVTLRIKVYYFVSRDSYATLIFADAPENFENSVAAMDQIAGTFAFLP